MKRKYLTIILALSLILAVSCRDIRSSNKREVDSIKIASFKKFLYFCLLFLFFVLVFTELGWPGWEKLDLGSGGAWSEGVAIGNGRNHGIYRVYAGNVDDHIYEFSWSGSSWTKEEG